MAGFSVSHRRMVAVASAVIGVLSLGSFIYWAAIVAYHPWIKHILLFGVLTMIAFAIAVVMWPRESPEKEPVDGDDASPLT